MNVKTILNATDDAVSLLVAPMVAKQPPAG